MRTLKTSEAAALLAVSASTLRAWERRYGYPQPLRSAGQHRLYTYGEVAALSDALAQGLSIQSAISRVRESLGGDTGTLVAALTRLDVDGADRAMESALVLRSFDSCVEDVLSRSLEELAIEVGEASATWVLAADWADGWLQRALRLAAPSQCPRTILLGDAGCGVIDGDDLALRALRLCCERVGLRIVVLPVACVSALADVNVRFAPAAVVIANSAPPHERSVLWAKHVTAALGPLPHALFRSPGLSTDVAAGAWRLPDTPCAAQRVLLGHLEQLAAATDQRAASA